MTTIMHNDSATEQLGPDWQMLQYLEEEEQRAAITLQKVYTEMVLTGKLDEESFNQLVYLTGVRK